MRVRIVNICSAFENLHDSLSASNLEDLTLARLTIAQFYVYDLSISINQKEERRERERGVSKKNKQKLREGVIVLKNKRWRGNVEFAYLGNLTWSRMTRGPSTSRTVL